MRDKAKSISFGRSILEDYAPSKLYLPVDYYGTYQQYIADMLYYYNMEPWAPTPQEVQKLNEFVESPKMSLEEKAAYTGMSPLEYERLMKL